MLKSCRQEEIERCHAVRAPTVEARVSVEVDETGFLRIENRRDAPARFVENIVTCAVAQPTLPSPTREELGDEVNNPSSSSSSAQDAYEVVVWEQGFPKVATQSGLAHKVSSLRLWIQHLNCIDELEAKKRAALQVALQSGPSNDFALQLCEATKGTAITLVKALESRLSQLLLSKRIDQVDSSVIELASLLQELEESDGVKAVQRAKAYINSNPQYQWQLRNPRRRASVRAIHVIRRAQDTWPVILAKAAEPASAEVSVGAETLHCFLVHL